MSIDDEIRTLERAAAAGDASAESKLARERARLVPLADAKTIHVRTWSGSECAEITCLVNAGKRGKTCRRVRVSVPWELRGSGSYNAAGKATNPKRGECLQFLNFTLPGLTGYESFDDVLVLCRAAVDVAGIELSEETIKDINAPRAVLTAGIEGVWSGSADETGICLADLTDRNNDPRSITHNQTPARAYDLARKIWHKVRLAKTNGEAHTILSEAGCNFHSYCAVD